MGQMQDLVHHVGLVSVCWVAIAIVVHLVDNGHRLYWAGTMQKVTDYTFMERASRIRTAARNVSEENIKEFRQ